MSEHFLVLQARRPEIISALFARIFPSFNSNQKALGVFLTSLHGRRLPQTPVIRAKALAERAKINYELKQQSHHFGIGDGRTVICIIAHNLENTWDVTIRTESLSTMKYGIEAIQTVTGPCLVIEFDLMEHTIEQALAEIVQMSQIEEEEPQALETVNV